MTDSSDAKPAVEPAAQQHDTPKPGVPKPGAAAKPGAPKPHPTPTHALSAPAVAAPAHSDPSKFGRVDDDGTAWVKTADGERQIGSWQAGDAAEGLAHFGRRFDDLATEVALLEARLSSGAGDAKKTKAAALALAESLPTAAVIGDIDSLAARLDVIIAGSDEAAAHAKHEKELSRQAHTERKEALAAEAEQIGAESTQWKAAGDRLREILDEWKTIRGIDRKVDDALWKRYSKAREAFNRRRGAHFAELDRERAAAKTKKEELVERAEALSDSTDWGPTAGAFRDLLAEWKAAGRAPREADDNLWKRFKGAQDLFFAARNAASSERDAEFEENAVAKEELLKNAGHIDPAKDIDAARAALRDLQEKWDAIGKVPRERMHDLEGKLRAIEKRVRDAADEEWRRTDPEALARAAQFRERVTQFEEQAAKATAAGKTKDAESALAQAQQWREWAEAAEGAVSGP
ncbi:DNA repair ATPase [Rhodococcus sp. SC4]|nr:DNA repair ATPase [Rhodococcus sp. SC4]